MSRTTMNRTLLIFYLYEGIPKFNLMLHYWITILKFSIWYIYFYYIFTLKILQTVYNIRHFTYRLIRSTTWFVGPLKIERFIEAATVGYSAVVRLDSLPVQIIWLSTVQPSPVSFYLLVRHTHPESPSWRQEKIHEN